MARPAQLTLFAPERDARLRAGLEVTSLQSGSTGNATLVRAGKTAILIDCGLSPARLTQRLAPLGLAPADLAAIFVTHEHADHAGGAGVVSRKFGVPLWLTEGTARAAGRILKGCAKVKHLAREGELALADGLRVDWLPVPHDAEQPVAFGVERKGVRFGVLTDLGHATPAVRDWFGRLDAALLETNHDETMLDRGRYPESVKRRIASRMGHLSNAQAARLVRDHASPRLRVLLLAHLSEENNCPDRAEETLRDALARRPDLTPRVEVTRRDDASASIEL
jgi:phosphoribosyl 1,2-cyclic phosphodiesterase